MTSNEPTPDFVQFLCEQFPAAAVGVPVVNEFRPNYWNRLREIAETDERLRLTMPGMIVAPEKVVIYLGKSHLAIEYSGPIVVPAKLNESTMITFRDCSDEDDLIAAMVGMTFKGANWPLPLEPDGTAWNLFIPTTGPTAILMADQGWDFTAEAMSFGLNVGGLALPEGHGFRMINCFFYQAEENRLRTRRVLWADFLPLSISPTDEEISDVIVRFPELGPMAEADALVCFPHPPSFETERLAILNRFREFIISPNVSEPQITAWLAEPAHRFILLMSLPAVHILHQRECKWIGQPERPAIIPDFFAVRSNGFADIVEFKLPELKGESIVGTINRERFSAEVASYISQTLNYKEYFQESANRQHVLASYGINVEYPKRVLVMGRRWEFENRVWRSVASEYPDLTILTYDDLLDSVSAVLYRNPVA